MKKLRNRKIQTHLQLPPPHTSSSARWGDDRKDKRGKQREGVEVGGYGQAAGLFVATSLSER